MILSKKKHVGDQKREGGNKMEKKEIKIEKATKPTKEEQEQRDMKLELKVKQDHLADKEARLNGGMSPIIKRKYISIDEEIRRVKLIVEMKKIELSKDAPLRPMFGFEQDDRWREIKRGFMLEELTKMETNVTQLVETKEKIEKEVPELKEKIKEIEEKLKDV